MGIITRFAPGTKENGTIFCHPTAGRSWLSAYWAKQAYDTGSMSFIHNGRKP